MDAFRIIVAALAMGSRYLFCLVPQYLPLDTTMRLPCPNLHPGGGYMTYRRRKQSVASGSPKVFARGGRGNVENDPEGVAFEYEVLE